MRVFVYEFLTAHGIGRDPADPLHGMYREGRAMRDAAAADFARLPAVDVVTFPEDTAPVEEGRVLDAAVAADATLLIAPESDGILSRLTKLVTERGGRLLGPSAEAVALTTDKLTLASHWRDRGIPTPATTDREPTPCEAFPVVWKPRDGCGSTAVFLLRSTFDLARAKAAVAGGEHAGPMIVQEYVPGRAASVAFLCGPAGNIPLAPTFQHLSDDGRFHYRGGELPLPPDLADRAVRLAGRAVGCVSGLNGYVGVDLVLGDTPDGSRDFAVEINPRLTTSYVGLRALADFNVAGALLAVARGTDPGELRWKPGRVRFAADGTATHAEQLSQPHAPA